MLNGIDSEAVNCCLVSLAIEELWVKDDSCVPGLFSGKQNCALDLFIALFLRQFE